MEIRGTAKLLRPGALLALFGVMALVVGLAAFVAGRGGESQRGPAPVVLPTGTPIGCLELSPVAELVPCGGGHDAIVWGTIEGGESCADEFDAIYRPGVGGAWCVTTVADAHRSGLRSHVRWSTPSSHYGLMTGRRSIGRPSCGSAAPAIAEDVPRRSGIVATARFPCNGELPRRFVSALVATTLLTTALVLPSAGASDRDIDGDGSEDLLIGVPLEDLAGRRDAGLVHVVLGPSGRSAPRFGGVIRQGGPITGRPQAGDGFGGSVELVDIDGDGHADAVIGSPGQRVGRKARAGVVHVVPGGPRGLVRQRAFRLVEGRGGLPGTPRSDDAFGWDVSAGDFDGDGYGDVAISAVGARAGGAKVAGSVTVIMGGVDGLDLSRSTRFSQAGAIAGRPANGDSFGRSLAVGDFDGDGFDDLAIGVPGERVRRQSAAGAVNILYGSATGLGTARNQRFTQPLLRGRAEAGDLFGFALAAVDLDCDGIDELAVGSPNEDLGNDPNTGIVQVISGSPDGLDRRSVVRLAAGRRGMPGVRANAGFGKALAGGDVDGDGCGDLVVGAPFATVEERGGAGAVTVVRGGPRWSTALDARLVAGRRALGRTPASGDFLGSSLAVIDWNGDGRDDVAIGVPGADVAGRRDAGALVIVEGGRNGLRPGQRTVLTQGRPLADRPEVGDQFSSTLQDALS
jgi:hypothetical protein